MEKTAKGNEYINEQDKVIECFKPGLKRDAAVYGFNEAWVYQAKRIYTLQSEVSRLEGLNAQYLEVMRYCLDRIGNQWEVKLKLQEALKLSRASSKEETQQN